MKQVFKMKHETSKKFQRNVRMVIGCFRLPQTSGGKSYFSPLQLVLFLLKS